MIRFGEGHLLQGQKRREEGRGSCNDSGREGGSLQWWFALV